MNYIILCLITCIGIKGKISNSLNFVAPMLPRGKRFIIHIKKNEVTNEWDSLFWYLLTL